MWATRMKSESGMRNPYCIHRGLGSFAEASDSVNDIVVVLD